METSVAKLAAPATMGLRPKGGRMTSCGVPAGGLVG